MKKQKEGPSKRDEAREPIVSTDVVGAESDELIILEGTSLDIARDGTPKDRLCKVLNEMRIVVLEKAGVKQTTFLHENAKESMAANNLKHGQYDFARLDHKAMLATNERKTARN